MVAPASVSLFFSSTTDPVSCNAFTFSIKATVSVSFPFLLLILSVSAKAVTEINNDAAITKMDFIYFLYFNISINCHKGRHIIVKYLLRFSEVFVKLLLQ